MKYKINGETARSYSIAEGTIFNILWQTIMEKNMSKNIHIRITESLCCTEESNNIVNQLYFNKIFKKYQNLINK